ncbi:MAG: sugar ABC transporter substrate-binding protein [Clostridia bacterium]|nr:sugar ABC transporter substrate-binding protein [Clostridia bacterium]
MKKTLRTLALVMAVLMLTAFVAVSAVSCGESAKKIKIGVLVADASGSEAVSFRNYYKNYIEGNYNVEFMYSNELSDAEAETAAIENFVTAGCKAIISLSSADRPAQIAQCEKAGVYYAVASGVLTDDEYNAVKNNKYYVGAIGPSLDVEFVTGYNMAKWAIAQGMTKFAIYGAGVGYRVDMHIQRTAGMLAALCEDEGTSYNGTSDVGAIIGMLYGMGEVTPAGLVSDKYQLVGYHALWNFGDATWQQTLSSVVAAQPEVILCAGTGLTVFGQAVTGTNVKIADIDSFTDDYSIAMTNGTVCYLAGKYASSIGPIFAATLNAINGNGIKGEGNTALALGQTYWVATSAEQFAKFQSADTPTAPIFNKVLLDTVIGEGISYDTFKTFVDTDRTPKN